MADRNIDFDPRVTRVVPQDVNTSDLTNSVAAIGNQAAEFSSQAKTLNAIMQTQLQFRQLDGDFRRQYAGDPTNEDGLNQLQQARSAVVDQMADQLPLVAQRQFRNKSVDLQETSNASNETWATRQQFHNGLSDLQAGITTGLTEANLAGKAFGQSGGQGDLGDALNYAQSGQTLKQYVTPILGADRVDAYLRHYNSDYAKAFVAGVAESHPQLAAQLLDNPQIKEHFSTQDIGDMADVIARTTKQQALIKSMQQTSSQADLTNIVNNPDTTYYDKRAMIDRLDMEGSITPKAAAAARRVIKSADDVDSQTDTPTMTGIINQVYDLNSNASTNSEDYLMGVRDIQQKILEAQDAGKLTGPDAKKLTDQVMSLTNKKVADATTQVGDDFVSANTLFDQLPPEFRGQATRALFYASYGKGFTPNQYNASARAIIDKINAQRRQTAQATLSTIQQQDTDFLKQTGLTEGDIAFTAKKYGMTPQEVIRQLRLHNAKVGNQQAKKPVQDVAPDAGADLEEQPREPDALDRAQEELDNEE